MPTSMALHLNNSNFHDTRYVQERIRTGDLSQVAHSYELLHYLQISINSKESTWSWTTYNETKMLYPKIVTIIASQNKVDIIVL